MQTNLASGSAGMVLRMEFVVERILRLRAFDAALRMTEKGEGLLRCMSF